MKTLEDFIKENSTSVPKAPANELESILKKIEQDKPWYKKFDLVQTILIPAMTVALVLTITFSIQQPNHSIDNAQLDAYVSESFDIYDPSAELSLLD